jgi:hypothetical protein
MHATNIQPEQIVEEHRAAADERGTQSTNKKKGKRKAVEQEQEQGERMVLTNNSTNNDADGTEAVETYAIDEPFTPDIETSSSHFLEAAPSTTAARPRNGKTVDFRQARPRTASGATLKFLDRDSYAERLTAYCGYIFSKADLDGDNALSIDEFAALVQSRTLDLDISDTDCGLMMKDYDQTNGGVAIGFSDFVYVMTDLMRRHSQRLKIDGHAAWEWFVLYFDDDPDSLPLYFNTERLAMTYDKPAGIDFREQDQDEQVFEIMVHNGTGAVYTTLVDETGQRMCVTLTPARVPTHSRYFLTHTHSRRETARHPHTHPLFVTLQHQHFHHGNSGGYWFLSLAGTWTPRPENGAPFRMIGTAR